MSREEGPKSRLTWNRPIKTVFFVHIKNNWENVLIVKYEAD